MSIQNLPRLPEQLAAALKLPSMEALRKSLRRWGIIHGRFDRKQPLSVAQVRDLATNYATKGSAATQQAASNLLDQLVQDFETDGADRTAGLSSDPADYLPTRDNATGHIAEQEKETGLSSPVPEADRNHADTTNGQQADAAELAVLSFTETDSAKRTDRKTETDTGVRSDWREVGKDLLLSAVALIAMLVQIVNTATVVQSAEQSDTWMAMAHSWAYAVAIQFTGLALTLYKGRLVYLQLFAVAEFGINLLYFSPWTEGGWEAWVTALLLSALIAFTIYSYVEIFAARRTQETDYHADC